MVSRIDLETVAAVQVSVIFILLSLLVLLGIELAYMPIARRNGWTTQRNLRRDGHPVTVIGGGLIFYLGMVLWSLGMGLIYDVEAPGAYFLIGLTMLATTSFADDILRLPVWLRLVVQFLAAAFLCFGFNPLYEHPLVALLYIVAVVGFVNGYNFMDGINGITAAYSVVVLGVLLYLDLAVVRFTSGSFIAIALGSAAIFGIFNFRRYALTFAGDVGSISMGFIVSTLLTQYCISQGDVFGLVMVSVYAVDIFATILRRIFEGENIFRAHRKHIYERLYFIWRVPQLVISTVYALLQLGISIGYLLMPDRPARLTYFLSVYGILIAGYIVMMIVTERRISRNINGAARNAEETL